MVQRDSFRYRKFTDCVVDKDGNPIKSEEEGSEVSGEHPQADPEHLAKGKEQFKWSRCL